jgi:hypothetical protein
MPTPPMQSAPAAPMYPAGQYPQPAPYGQPTDYAQPIQLPQPGPGAPAGQRTPHRRAALYCYTEPADQCGGAGGADDEDEPTFGQPGQMVFWGGGATILGTRLEGKDGNEGSTGSTIDIAPSFGFFLSKLIVVRAATRIWRTGRHTGTDYGFGIESGLGFHIPASRIVSVMPEVRLGVGWSQVSCAGYWDYSCSDQSVTQYWNTIGMPILFHLAPHLFIGAGPALTYTFNKSDDYNSPGNTLSVSLQGLIGGWL